MIVQSEEACNPLFHELILLISKLILHPFQWFSIVSQTFLYSITKCAISSGDVWLNDSFLQFSFATAMLVKQ